MEFLEKIKNYYELVVFTAATQEYADAEVKYNQLKELQAEIDVQAAAFESDLDDEEFYSPEDYDY